MNHAFDLKNQWTFCFAPRSRFFSSVFSKSFMVFTCKSILSSFFKVWDLGLECFFKFFLHIDIQLFGLPMWCNGKEPACQCRRHKRCGFNPWVGKIAGRRKWEPTPVFLPGSLDRGTWWTTVLGVAKSQTQLSNWARCGCTSNCSYTSYSLRWIASAPLSKIMGPFCVYLLSGSLFFLLIYVSNPPPKQFDD